MLWIGAALFGAFEGPLWPAMLSLLSEEYGLELRATQTAMVLVMAKFGIFSECAPARLHLPVSLSVSICQTFVSAVRVAYVVTGRLSSRCQKPDITGGDRGYGHPSGDHKRDS